MSPEFEKPSVRMGMRIIDLLRVEENKYRSAMEMSLRRPITDEKWNEIRERPEVGAVVAGQIPDVTLRAIFEEMDREAERRHAWEQSIEAGVKGSGI